MAGIYAALAVMTVYSAEQSRKSASQQAQRLKDMAAQDAAEAQSLKSKAALSASDLLATQNRRRRAGSLNAPGAASTLGGSAAAPGASSLLGGGGGN